MTETASPPAPIPGTPAANDLVVRGADGDPLPHPRAVRMIEKESYERVIEGLKMAADACMHIAKQEPQNGPTWREIGKLLDKLRRDAARLAGLELTMRQLETSPYPRGLPYGWKQARQRFLDGLRQATGGMRQLATCFRADLRWSLLAQELERREGTFRSLLVGRPVIQKPRRILLPPGFRGMP